MAPNHSFFWISITTEPNIKDTNQRGPSESLRKAFGGLSEICHRSIDPHQVSNGTESQFLLNLFHYRTEYQRHHRSEGLQRTFRRLSEDFQRSITNLSNIYRSSAILSPAFTALQVSSIIKETSSWGIPRIRGTRRARRDLATDA